VVVSRDEHDYRARPLGTVSGVGEAPSTQERVVRPKLVAVIRGTIGEVEFDEQVEGELRRVDA
jgi:hypothetical protein